MDISTIISEALKEDIGSGDHTSLSTIPSEAKGKAKLLIKEAGILAGVEVAREVFRQVDPFLVFESLISDGTYVRKGDIAFTIEGHSTSIVMGERLALNFMQRMSGIATATYHMVKKLEGLHTKVLDTRKTTPLLRTLEKLAVRLGGGANHRMGLYDMILIKDNHVDYASGIGNAIRAAKAYLEKHQLKLPVEIEARNLEEVKEILSAGSVDRIMLDNFSFEDLKKAVQMINGKYETEASGGITIDTVRQYAECGVDFVSVGSLTHHINSLDMSLKAI